MSAAKRFGRYSTHVVSVRIADVDKTADGRPRWRPGSDVELIRVGGRWDRKKKRWIRGVRLGKVLVLRFHRGQEEGARWLVEWLRRFALGDWAGVARVWAAILIGGRRSGKTHLACAVMIAFSVLAPGARQWAISPTLETGDELDRNFRDLMPRGWCKRRQAKTGRATSFRFANGSMINLRSAVKPERLKAGRVDIALLNEAQEMSERAFHKLAAAVADRGGLVLIAANPPERPIGKWVETLYNKTRAGEADAVAFFLDPRSNPWIVYAAIVAMAKVMDKKTYERDALGLFPPIGDTVLHSWSEHNFVDPWPELIDITAEVARRELSREAGDLIGMDFQALPAMVGIVHRVFRDPKTNLEMLWVVDEAVAEESDEQQLIDALEAIPRWHLGDGTPSSRPAGPCYRGGALPDEPASPEHAAVIMDASGFFQDGEHAVNRTSEKWLRAADWKNLHRPAKGSDRNPPIIERMRTANALLENTEGTRRLFVARHCTRTAEALREYEFKNGVPNRRSKHAHIVDGVTYVAYRLYGVPVVKRTTPQYHGAGRFKRAGMFSTG